jgi:hypothetical protein
VGWKRRPAAWELRGLKKRGEREWGPLERRERGGKKDFSFSFKFLFQFVFQTFKLQSNRKPCI